MDELYSASDDSWTVLFGGRGREGTVVAMLENGYKVSSLVFPEEFSEVSKDFLSLCNNFGLKVEFIGKKNLEMELSGGTNLLSIGFPFILSKRILSSYKLCLNIHPTLLPKYKGPSSGAYIIINGEAHSGSTIHVMTEKLDDGPILGQIQIEIDEFDTIRSVQEKVYGLEPELLLTTLHALKEGIKPIPSEKNTNYDYLKKRTPSDSKIDPSRPLIDLVAKIRACDPEGFPAFFEYEGEIIYVKLWRRKKIRNQHPKSL